MIRRIVRNSLCLLPVEATSLVRRMMPRPMRVWLRDRMIADITEDRENVTSKDGRIFKTIEDGLFFRVFYEGIYEPQLTAAFEKFIRPQDVILDVGGNFGWYATLFGKFATAGTVITYEPVPDTFEILCENIHFNGLDAIVRPHRLCVGKQEGNVPFIRTDNSGLGHVAVDENTSPGDAVDTSLVTLDSHAAEWTGRVALVKIHVEGFELDVLHGAGKLLASKVQPVVQVKLTDDRLERYGVHRNDIFEFLQSHNYRLFEMTTSGAVSPTEQPKEVEIFGVGHGVYADRFCELFA